MSRQGREKRKGRLREDLKTMFEGLEREYEREDEM